jgi:hypothetical protein
MRKRPFDPPADAPTVLHTTKPTTQQSAVWRLPGYWPAWQVCDVRSNHGFASSKTSSQVTTRSREGIAEDRQLSMVVFTILVERKRLFADTPSPAISAPFLRRLIERMPTWYPQDRRASPRIGGRQVESGRSSTRHGSQDAQRSATRRDDPSCVVHKPELPVQRIDLRGREDVRRPCTASYVARSASVLAA